MNQKNTTTLLQKTILTLIFLLFYTLSILLYPTTAPCGFAAGIPPILSHFLFIFLHANIWHLLGNIFVLWLMPPTLRLLPAVMIAYLCSFLPAWGFWPMGTTIGFSGVLFAIIGIKWGFYCRRATFRRVAYAEFCMKVLPFALIGIILPNVNWCLHLYCLLAGLLYARYKPPLIVRFHLHFP